MLLSGFDYRRLVILISAGLFFLFDGFAQNITVNIQGTVTDNQTGNPLSVTKVVLVRPDNGQRLDSTYTNQVGYYNKDFVVSFTGTRPVAFAGNCAWPNPCQNQVNIQFQANENGNYNLQMFSSDGRTISDFCLNLKRGINVVSLEGGAAGIVLIRITNGRQNAGYRILRLQGSDVPVSCRLATSGTSLKSVLENSGEIWPGMEIRMEFSKTGYYMSDTTFVVEPAQTINRQLQAAATIQGTITGNIYNNPIAGTRTTLLYQGNDIDSTFTDTFGQYSFIIPVTVPLNDQVTLEFEAPASTYINYLPGDTTFAVLLSQTINKKLEQIPYDFTTTLKPFLETGEQISMVNPNWTTTIEWPDGETTTHSIANQQIQLEKEMYPLNNTLGSIVMHHDTASYNVAGVENGVLNWILIREPHQKTNRANIAQSESSNHMANVTYTTEVPLDSLDNKLIYYYTIRKRAETQQGVYERLDSPFSRNLVEHSGSGKSSMFIDLKPFGVADSLDIVQKSWNETTGEQMSQADLDRSMNLLMQVLQTRYLPNGDTLLPPHRIYTITTNNDPRWQAVIARGGANSIKLTYTSGTPGNQRAWSNTHTYNGELRINYTGAFYNNVNNDAQIYEELISIVTGIEEGSGAMAPYIWNGTTWQPSQYAYSIAPISGLLNLGTGQNVE